MTDAIQPKPKHIGHTIKALLEQNASELQKVLPKHLTLERLLKVALYCIDKTPKLQECSPQSLVACIKQCAELGLEPGGALGLAYLVPYGTVCTLIIGYRGLIELARRSGKLAQIEAHVIHANDEFKVEFGLEPVLRHIPKLDGVEGAPKAVYCVARMADGSKHVEVMTWDAVMKIKGRSKSGGSGPWVTDEEEMARKTVVRRAAKYLPLSPELADAFMADDHDFVDAEVVTPGLQLPSDTSTESATQKTKAAVKRKLQIEDAPMPTPPPAPEPQVEAEQAANPL